MTKRILLISAAFLTVLNETNAQSPLFSWAKGILGTSYAQAHSTAINASCNVYTTYMFEGTADFDPGPGIFNLTPSSTTHAIFISKLDASGNFIWAKKMDGIAGNGSGHAIACDTSGNIYIAGDFSGDVDFDPGPGVFMLYCTAGSVPIDIFVSKLDPSGNFLWAKQMAGTGQYWANGIDVDDAGNVYTTGTFRVVVDFDPGPGIYNLTCSGNYDIFVSKLDASGNFVWAKRMGGSNNTNPIGEAGQSIAVDIIGNVYTTGLFHNTADFDPGTGVYNLTSPIGSSTFISKLNSSGNFIWAKGFIGTGSSARGYSLTIDYNDNVCSTGYFTGTTDFDPGAGIYNLTSAGEVDIFVSKLDSSGDVIWAKSMGGLGTEWGATLSFDAMHNVYIAGKFSTDTIDIDPGAGVFNLLSNGSNDIFVCKLNSSGNFVWAKSAGDTRPEYCTTINVNHSGGVYIAGYFYSTTIAFDSVTLQNPDSTYSAIFIAKLNDVLPTGFEVANNNNFISIYPNPTSDIFTIALLNNNKVAVTITNITGLIIYSTLQIDKQMIAINSNYFEEGVYFVKIQSKDFIETKKLIVAR